MGYIEKRAELFFKRNIVMLFFSCTGQKITLKSATQITYFAFH